MSLDPEPNRTEPRENLSLDRMDFYLKIEPNRTANTPSCEELNGKIINHDARHE